MKIIIQERKTISASENVAELLTQKYNKNFLKLISLFLKHKYTKTKKDAYLQALETLKQKYPSYFDENLKIGSKDFISRLKNVEDKISYTILEIPAASIVPHILAGDTAQKALISARMDEEEATDQILAYFKQKGLKKIDCDLELSISTEKFGGLMDYGHMTISIIYPSELFKTVLFFKKDVDKFINQVEGEISDTKRKVYHELQHLFVDVIKNITGFSRYGHGPRSRETGELPNKDPEEIQTYAQEAVTIFGDMIRDLKIKPKQIKVAKSALLNKILGHSLSAEQEKVFASLNKDISEKYIKMIKSNLDSMKKFDPKFYNYVLEILFSSVRDDASSVDPLTVPISKRYRKKLRENIIKIILR